MTRSLRKGSSSKGAFFRSRTTRLIGASPWPGDLTRLFQFIESGQHFRAVRRGVDLGVTLADHALRIDEESVAGSDDVLAKLLRGTVLRNHLLVGIGQQL